MKETRDILVLFEALNNHEIFTPPRLAKEMLELLPDEVWVDPSLKFLDPCTKSGVFLREIFYKLYEGLKNKGVHKAHDGLEYNLDNDQERINHILKNMIYGIATSELTGYVARRTLYGVMEANTDKQLAALDSFTKSDNYHQWSEEEQLKFVGRNKFNEYYNHKMFNTKDYKGFEEEGNIFYPADEVAKKVLEDGNYEVEDTYYPFINEETKHRKILDIKEGKMKFDVIIGNPPYQISDGGAGSSAKSIYNYFIEQSIELNPKYLIMIIPARWYNGGKGLLRFRERMLNDTRLREIHDFPNTKDLFPGLNIRGGICYFLWDREHNGDCEVFNYENQKVLNKIKRPLLEKDADIFVRYNNAISILHKVKKYDFVSFSDMVSSRKPFGLGTNFSGFSVKKSKSKDIILYKKNQEQVYISLNQVENRINDVKKWKVIVSKASPGDDSYPHSIISKPIISQPGSCSTETYIMIGPAESKIQSQNIANYMTTIFFRFMVLLSKSTQDVTKKTYQYAPILNFDEKWNDEKLFKKYSLSEEEVVFMKSLIKPMSVNYDD